MEVARFYETLISNYHNTRHNNPENHELDIKECILKKQYVKAWTRCILLEMQTGGRLLRTR
jgi:hypothetical protein